MKNTIRFSIFLLCLVFVFSQCQNSTAPAATSSSSDGIDQTKLSGQSGVTDADSEKNILQVALGSADHSTLVAGVTAAGLGDVLTNAGPLTVFAPNNAAFDKLPAGTLETLLKPENKAQLARIIKYHAAPGSYTGAGIRGVMGIGQATGDKVKVTMKDGDTFINGAKILGTVKASNGWVHVIDGVLLPPDK